MLNTLSAYRTSSYLKGRRRKLRERSIEGPWMDAVASVLVAMELATVLIAPRVARGAAGGEGTYRQRHALALGALRGERRMVLQVISGLVLHRIRIAPPPRVRFESGRIVLSVRLHSSGRPAATLREQLVHPPHSRICGSISSSGSRYPRPTAKPSRTPAPSTRPQAPAPYAPLNSNAGRDAPQPNPATAHPSHASTLFNAEKNAPLPAHQHGEKRHRREQQHEDAEAPVRHHTEHDARRVAALVVALPVGLAVLVGVLALEQPRRRRPVLVPRQRPPPGSSSGASV